MIVHGEKSTSMGRRVDRLAKAFCILKELVGRGLKAMCLGVRRKKMGRVPNIAYVPCAMTLTSDSQPISIFTVMTFLLLLFV